MGQNESKYQGGAAPFENYQGSPMGPPGLVTAQYGPTSGRVVALDDGTPPWNGEDPPFVLQQPNPMPGRTTRGNMGPPRGMPRRDPFGGPSVVNGPGYAQALRDGMRVEAAQEAAWYRSPPPQSYPDPQPLPRPQPNIKTIRTVINEPRGYAPPGQQATQSYQTTQTYQVQSQPQYQVQAATPAQQPTQVLYYDQKTGALTSGAQQYTTASAAPQVVAYQQPQVLGVQQPQVLGIQQPQVLGYQAQPQVIGYAAQPQVLAAPQVLPQVVGYQQTAQPIAFAYPQQQQSQPIVVPGQLYTANGGVQQLG